MSAKPKEFFVESERYAGFYTGSRGRQRLNHFMMNGEIGVMGLKMDGWILLEAV